MSLHCIYCRERLPVTRILFDQSPPEEQLARLIFEIEHERCGPKAIGMIVEVFQ
jgi:hypothetical protein